MKPDQPPPAVVARAEVSRVLSEAKLIETNRDETKKYYKPQVPDPRFPPENPWAEVNFLVITQPADASRDFRLTWMSFEGSCRTKRVSAIHGTGMQRETDKRGFPYMVSFSADETPFTPERGSAEGRALRLACAARSNAQSTAD